MLRTKLVFIFCAWTALISCKALDDGGSAKGVGRDVLGLKRFNPGRDARLHLQTITPLVRESVRHWQRLPEGVSEIQVLLSQATAAAKAACQSEEAQADGSLGHVTRDCAAALAEQLYRPEFQAAIYGRNSEWLLNAMVTEMFDDPASFGDTPLNISNQASAEGLANLNANMDAVIARMRYAMVELAPRAHFGGDGSLVCLSLAASVRAFSSVPRFGLKNYALDPNADAEGTSVVSMREWAIAAEPKDFEGGEDFAFQLFAGTFDKPNAAYRTLLLGAATNADHLAPRSMRLAAEPAVPSCHSGSGETCSFRRGEDRATAADCLSVHWQDDKAEMLP